MSSKYSGRANRKTKFDNCAANENILDLKIEKNKRTKNASKTNTPNIEITPRNKAQVEFYNCLLDQSNHIILALGSAGTGKTFISTLYALKELLCGNVKKILITRPTVTVGEDLGYFPGTLVQKMTPWCRPFMDVFTEFLDTRVLNRMIENSEIEICALGMLRGRSFKNTIIIADEMQNSSQEQMKMILTRIGEGSRMIITGDLDQHDRKNEVLGLKDAAERLESVPGISISKFTLSDIERHPIITSILERY